MSLILKASRFAARRLGCRWLPLRKGQGVVSFSFDDVPASACLSGAALLEQYDARATFYICGQLTDGIEQHQPCHSVSDLQRLVASGHELGCHTFSHTNCANTPIARLRQDWDKNQAFFQQNDLPTNGFAFPFGAYRLGSKLAANRRFSYNRITGGGLQLERADLSALRAQALYAANTSADMVLSLIRQAAQEGGWLIFYSHEVTEQPGPWGTTPDQLDMALRIARQEHCQILPVQAAIDFFRS
ncbi:polysaccharide deacetylase family protein [Undibacterium sp. SXout7W]|uniref:polysaccharide deacetylase family protein n=1 Tax=Undibacterium sp. SXout7W TaxID=3413049 RepID=UPI003BF1F589